MLLRKDENKVELISQTLQPVIAEQENLDENIYGYDLNSI